MPNILRLKAYRYRVNFTREQELLAFEAGHACRWVYNEAYIYRENMYRLAKSAGAKGLKGMGYVHLASLLSDWKDAHPWLARAPHHCLQQALRDLDGAYAKFFKGETGHPRPRKKDRDPLRFRFPDPKQIALDDEYLDLPKFGRVKLRRHGRAMPGKLKQVTVKQEGGRWSVSILMVDEVAAPVRENRTAIGIDAGVKNTLSLSSGETFNAPVMTEPEARRLRRLERQAARKMRGSSRHRCALLRVARFRQKITNRLSDWRHQTTTRLAKNHGFIAVEKLALRNMTRSARGTVEAPGRNVSAKAGLNRALLEPGLGAVFSQLEYKQRWLGHVFERVEPAFSSQDCPCCGHRDANNRPTRDRFRCVKCSLEGPADNIAGINILHRGLAQNATAAGWAVTVRRELTEAPRPANLLNVPLNGGSDSGIPVKAAHAA